MSLTLSRPWLTDILRATPRRALHLGSLALALIGFLSLTHGQSIGPHGTAVAYGEAVHYSVAPTALGRVERVLVHVGQRVAAGDELAVLDGSELAAEQDRAQAQLAQLESAVAARLQDEEFQVTRSELWVLKARAAEQGDRAQLAEIAQRMGRLDALLAEQMISANAAEAAREKEKELTARIETFDQAKRRGQAGLAQNGAGDHDHDHAVTVHVEPARQAVLVQQAALRQIELRIAQLTLRAPVDGTVTTLSHRPGEVVSAGSEIVGLVSGRPGVIWAELPEGMAARVSVGQLVTARPKDIFTTALQGRVIELAPEVDEVLVRARPSPSISAWGRRAAVQLESGGDVLPGQAFSVALD